jgi:hypothetical protein
MNKGKAVLAIAIIIGGAALYIMSTRKKKATLIPETLDKIQKEEEGASTNVKVDSLMPSFGVPRNILPPSTKPPVFKNYIDVQTNNYFKPKSGVFYQ